MVIDYLLAVLDYGESHNQGTGCAVVDLSVGYPGKLVYRVHLADLPEADQGTGSPE
jgi:hypothetical protein